MGDKPLTTRSVLASALLGLDRPEARVADLIRFAELFGISENRTRVALTRMVSAGEASTDGSGRYRLEGDLLHRQARQRVSLTGATRRWDGSWTIVVATSTLDRASTRHRRRRALVAARLAELREGVWARPDNLDVDLPAWLNDDVERITGTFEQDASSLAARLWDLEEWADDARILLARFESTSPDDPALLAAGFELAAAALRHLLTDPLLPVEVLPDDWPGSELRSVNERWDRRYRRQLTAWYRSAQ